VPSLPAPAHHHPAARTSLVNAEGPEIDAGREAIGILLDPAHRTSAHETSAFTSTPATSVYTSPMINFEPVERIHTLETATPAHFGPGLEYPRLRGGAGNRTPVHRGFARTSPSAACCASLGPSDHASKSV